MAYNPLSPEEIRAAIVDEARRLFLENGIAATEMKQIAANCGIGRSTLYRYFSKKEQLIFLVAEGILVELFVNNAKGMPANPKTGYEKLASHMRVLVEQLPQKLSFLAYLSEFDQLFEGRYPDLREAEHYIRTIQDQMNWLARYCMEGQSDGSIRAGEEPHLIVAVLINTAMGVAQRVLRRSDHYHEEQFSDGMRIVRQAVNYELRQLKGGR